MDPKHLKRTGKATPLHLVAPSTYKKWTSTQDKRVANWLKTMQFKAEPGQSCAIPSPDGGIDFALAIMENSGNRWHWAALAEKLPAGVAYAPQGMDINWDMAVLGWTLGTYRFTGFKEQKTAFPLLFIGKQECDVALRLAESCFLVSDLVNRPANDLGPEKLALACREVAQECGADYSDIIGDDLLAQNYPAIHAVGRACDDAPRLVDLHWGDARHPLVTLVGKGVCFDTGGLNLKTGSGMLLMKKDMGGAAHAIGLARLIMKTGLKVHLRVLIPMVQNSIAGNAFRPSDVLQTRKGLTVEVGNTDAEGRLILCDALAEADSEKPDLLIDMATLTGASRIALGPDIPSYFTPDAALAEDIAAASRDYHDPLWQLPLWEDYAEYLESNVADVNNAPGGSYAGAITAALFLQKFVSQTQRWVHVDMMAWSTKSRPGRPVGGMAQGLMALYHLIQKRYG